VANPKQPVQLGIIKPFALSETNQHKKHTKLIYAIYNV